MTHLRFLILLFPALCLIFGCAATSQKRSLTLNKSSDDKISALAKSMGTIHSNPFGPYEAVVNASDMQDKISPETDLDITDETSTASPRPSGNILSQTNTPETTGQDTIDNPDTDNTLSEISIQPNLDKALEYCQASQDFWQKGEFENAILALDQAYSFIIKVETNDTPKLIQQKEDLRFMISKRILEIYASRNTVVNGNHNAIPITINKHVKKEIDHYTTGNGRIFFIESYKRSGSYRQKMVAALREAGLPASLSWLPLIESGFKIRALSRARALGLWQFIPSTGYKFGLKRNMYIDERLDPDKATEAAVSYLKELHQIFGDWTTVLAAYNCGEGRVLRIIRSQNVNYLDNFWDLYEKLPWETARYVPKFLATLHIVNNLDKYGLDTMVADSPIDYQTIEISKQVSLNDIADKIGVSIKFIADLNPELRHKILPPDAYRLKIPPEKKDMLLTAIDEIPETSPPRSPFVYHRVRRGQTLSTIAKRYRTTTGRIARANKINRRNYIVAGKLLKIPMPGTYTPKVYKRAKASQHIVKRGDSLWLIAKRYGSTTRKIQKANNLSTTKLHIGQILNIPGYKDKTPTLKNVGKYTVKSGDNPAMIAQQHNMSLDQLLTLNHLSKRSKIFPGQELYVSKTILP